MTSEARQRYKDSFEATRQRFQATGAAEAVLRQRTADTDEGVLSAFSQSLAQAAPDGLALLAVGGYGRKELFPHSDVDLLVLVRKSLEDSALKGPIAEFLRLLWDSGLRASHSVRTVEDCCTVHEGNFELTVSLLDERFLAGNPVLYGQFRERFARFLKAERRDLERRLCRMARGRHARFHDTIYRLEPDIKEAPGGMRDLQTVRWLRALRDHQGDDGTDPRARQFLATTRCFLHFRAGRDSNLLNFEAQDEIAAAPFSKRSEPAEWMREYYRHASVLWREALLELEASETRDKPLLTSFRDWRSRLSNSEFTVSRDLIFLRNPHELATDLQLPLRLFRFAAKHGLHPSRETQQRLTGTPAKTTRAGEAFWKDFFSQPHPVAGLRAMAVTGFLSSLLPEWDRIAHLVVRDFYHQYTVDEHTLVALEVLEELGTGAPPERKRFADLVEESCNDLWLLRLALLLHDIGKGSGTDHSAEAVRLAGRFLEREGVAPEAAQTIQFLIEHHLLLSSTMQSRDVADPVTARAVTMQVKTVERLRLLVLLTFADISAVHPTAMSPWRMEQLWRLYRATARDMARELTEPDGESPEEVYGPIPPNLAHFLEGLPWRYLWTHSLAQAEVHCALFEQAETKGAALSIEKVAGVWQLAVVAKDRPFLFASLAGALSSFGLNILRAEAYSNRAGAIVDNFAFSDPNSNLDLNPPERERLRHTIQRVIVGEVHVEDLLRYRRPKPLAGKAAAIRAAVTPDSEASGVATVFEVVAEDRPGLLYHLASAISRAGCNIEVVLVDTEAHKAIDVFHVTKSGRALLPEEITALQAALLAACEPSRG